MKRKELPSQEKLKELFDYNPLTGDITNKKTGYVLGSKSTKSAYIAATINGTKYNAHAVIWKLMKGELPKHLVIDHKDDNPRNNRWNNFQLLTRYENMIKGRKWRQRGYSQDKNTGKWEVGFTKKDRYYYLGSYVDKEEAIRVANEWKANNPL